jgi:hypothetical protein
MRVLHASQTFYNAKFRSNADEYQLLRTPKAIIRERQENISMMFTPSGERVT